jgi:uncharacterized protein (DUF111 family)
VIVGEEDEGAGRALDRGASGEVVLQTNVDDLDPELYPYVLERLFDAGAQDAWLTPIIMKKGRPAVMVGVLCAAGRQDAIRRVLFTETGTLGVRSTPVDKVALDRDWIEVVTDHGKVSVKIGYLDGKTITVSPEFEDCARIAREADVPARDVYAEAARIAREQLGAER